MCLRIAILLFVCCAATRAGTFTDKTTNLHFPDQIGAWKKTHLIQFPDKTLGVEINYKGRSDAIASFVVFSGGTSNIPTGAENRLVQMKFSANLDESMAYVRSRFKDVAKSFDSNPSVKHGRKRATLLASAFLFSGDRKWMQYQLMTGYKNRFLKLIYTQPFNNPKTDIPRGQKELRDLILTWLDNNDENRNGFWQ